MTVFSQHAVYLSLGVGLQRPGLFFEEAKAFLLLCIPRWAGICGVHLVNRCSVGLCRARAAFALGLHQPAGWPDILTNPVVEGQGFWEGTQFVLPLKTVLCVHILLACPRPFSLRLFC